MANKISKRKAEALQWEEHKNIIASLYLEQGRTINDVQKIISAPPYNFSRRCVPLGNISVKRLAKTTVAVSVNSNVLFRNGSSKNT